LELIGLPVPSPISPAPSPPPPPDVVAMAVLGGRYEVGELLAAGGMAEVRRGHDQWEDRDVAIKTLLPELAQDDTFRIRFRREARSAARLSHPTIVSVYDTGEESDPNGQVLTYIVMEYVVGLTLRQLLASDGRLQPRQAFEIASDICVALDVSHDKGIVHRDIKPANVMVTLAGQVKVMDFGIAATLSTRRGSGAADSRSAPRPTCPRSSSSVRSPTAARTSTPPAACSTSCSPGRRPSPASRRRSCGKR
jgi:serine/threonine protein kinase